MSALRSFAENELARLMPEGGCEMQEAMNADILSLVSTFAEQGHSGMSAAYAIGALQKLVNFEPLTPLTGEDDEWNECGPGLWQNRRCPSVFKEEDGQAYNIAGKVFVEPDGVAFTNSESRVPVTFPYTPKTEYVERPA